MPAMIAHILASEEALKLLKKSKKSKNLVKVIETHKGYYHLGALGPDLPYFHSLYSMLNGIILEELDRPEPVLDHGYRTHSKDPNVIVLKMAEIIWREASNVSDWTELDKQGFAFLCGYLTHMALDQIMHPIVNALTGPYYKSGVSRKLHRKIEAHQDVFLYYNLVKSNLSKRKLRIFKRKRGMDKDTSLPNMEDVLDNKWFIYFIQKGFIEAHSIKPPKDLVRAWLRNINLLMHLFLRFNPYKRIIKDVNKNGLKNAVNYDDYFSNITSPELKEQVNYLNKFSEGVELAMYYIRTVNVIYNNDVIDDRTRKIFSSVVRNADLSWPIEDKILKNAKKHFYKNFRTHKTV